MLPEEAGAGASQALDKAVEDLEFRNYLLSKRPKEDPYKKKAANKSVMMSGSSARKANNEDDEENSEEEWDALLDEDQDLEALRRQRLEQMKKADEEEKMFRSKSHGEYREIQEQEFLPEVTGSALVACHFFHKDFERCKILDMHLHTIAPQLLPVKFIKLNAEKAGFFVGKLGIKTLPTLVFFKDGVAADRLIGFDGLGGDEFKTEMLLARITAGLMGEQED